MNGYIKKQALMDYCSNQVTRTIDLNDIARFPIAEVFTKHEVIAMLTEIQLELDEMKITKVRSAGFAPYSKDPFRRGVNCSKEIIQQKIDKLKENKDGMEWQEKTL